MEENVTAIRDPKNFILILIGQKIRIESMKLNLSKKNKKEKKKRSNESLAENKIKKQDSTIIVKI